MRSALLVVLVLGCAIGPPPGIAAPTTVTECAPIEDAIVGTWARDRSAMEVRADGSILRDAVEGAIRWTSPGHATIDVPGLHEDHAFGLESAAIMLDVDADGHARVWSRVSIVPAYPERCFELRGSIVGGWSDGATTETFGEAGAYRRGELEGHWSIPEPGRLEVAIGTRVRRYRVAFATRDDLLTVFDGPMLEEDPRGAVQVEARVH